jgi:hypothetical protein
MADPAVIRVGSERIFTDLCVWTATTKMRQSMMSVAVTTGVLSDRKGRQLFFCPPFYLCIDGHCCLIAKASGSFGISVR